MAANYRTVCAPTFVFIDGESPSSCFPRKLISVRAKENPPVESGILLLSHVSSNTMTQHSRNSSRHRRSRSRSRARTFDRKSDGIAGLLALAFSLANKPALLPRFCLLPQRLRVLLKRLYFHAVVLKSCSLPSSVLSLKTELARRLLAPKNSFTLLYIFTES